MDNPDAGEHAPIGILCAMPEERALLSDALTDQVDLSDLTLTAHRGLLDGHATIVAEAGVGKVAAAASATLLLERHACASLLLSGVAGGLSPALAIGDLVIATRVVDVDYGRSTDAGLVVYQPGSLPLAHLEPAPGYELPAKTQRRIREHLDRLGLHATMGTVLSGDTFLTSARIGDELARNWSGLAIEMEGAAVCGVATRFAVPWFVVRALSDRVGDDSSVDFAAFVTSAAAAAAGLVRALLPVVAQTRRTTDT